MQSTQKPITDPITAPDPVATLVAASQGVSRTLRDAATYLTRYGWIQGCFYDPAATVFTPAACLVGALGMVCYGGPVESPAYQFDEPGFDDFTDAVGFLEYHLATSTGLAVDAYAFNDTKGRTAEAVIAVLCEAADAWDEAAHKAGEELSRLLAQAADPSRHLIGGAA